MCHSGALIGQGVELQGAEFAFTVAPNKNTLYGKYMPDRFQTGSGEGNLEHLIREMKAQKVHYVDLQTPLRKEQKQVYHKLDTHWNNLGASIACGTLLGYFGKDHIHYENESYTRKKIFRRSSGNAFSEKQQEGLECDLRPFMDV
ncbi:hypothetical protein DXB96_11435 [Clostridium sp. OM07-10AC]|nr:hypothetical protein DXB96_11435 [Clostridium sp. OM07-10AC]